MPQPIQSAALTVRPGTTARPHASIAARVAVLLTLLAGLALTGCGSSDGAAPAAEATYTAIIDVRTPAEFASGHVEGAQNIDVGGPGFDQAVAELDAAGTYLVYCRSGNRSAQAASRMRDAGLSVQDGGGLQDMTSAGFPLTS